jgi:chromodomain-helicase-DNA-binding protein 4
LYVTSNVGFVTSGTLTLASVDTEADITHLIEKTEQANDEEVDEEGGGFSFSFAKVWAAEKAALDELPEPAAETEDWAATLAKMGEERAKAAAAEIQGRGARRKATQAVQYGAGVDDVVDKDKDKKKVNKGKRKAEDSDFSASDDDSISGSSSAGEREEDPAFQPPTGADLIQCGLCAGRHRPGEVCSMTENSDFLAEYRMILLTQSSHEPWQKRVSSLFIHSSIPPGSRPHIDIR